ncbi:MAG: HAD superfamily protein involved in N-acetyl-glucosamine catabolism [uncultured Microvirga sp.]|uniref:HAD superfamily protein involved in N-acetyl-glucosamine catabolism n=1 Tax=uncultured Microvirga sp. TaxID=412392 RepID=A0A6J4LM70_9HYPH|nr:MAG: HAD superfamily protein involved in N-acetyl-glucosamine catabolism [uncultured Microvirga sp.]
MTLSRLADRPLSFIAGLGEIASAYDLVLCDVWGVLHNGVVAFPPAADALIRFREQGGLVVLVSNAPRPGSGVVRQLDRLGVPRSAFDGVMTSGDLTRMTVAERSGQPLHHIGPERDRPIFDGLDAPLGPLDKARYVVCSGFFDDERETVADYDDRLNLMRERAMLMICANPDLVVERGHELLPCAGAIAASYEQRGGEVFYAGKPHAPVYEAALALAAKLSGEGPIAPERVLAIGDAIRTDIAGAARFGIASLLVTRGIHAGELAPDGGSPVSSHVQDWLTRQEARPNFVAETLAWS